MKSVAPFILIALFLFSDRLFAGVTFGSNDVLSIRAAADDREISPLRQDEALIKKYLGWYGMDDLTVRECGFFRSQGRWLFSLTVFPKTGKPRGTVILLHGYLEHSGNLGEAARRLSEKGFAVVLFDLPGHGLSEGDRGAIDDFGVYANALRDVMEMVNNRYPAPFVFIGHSTGCAAALELLHEKPRTFDAVIFVAPLVHPSFWGFIRAGYFLGSAFMGKVERSYFDVSGDAEYVQYLEFMKGRDPLQVQAVPVKWVKALMDWNERLVKYPVIPIDLTVIQGDSDLALDWKDNLVILKDKFSNVSVTIVPGGKHVLFHETAIRKKILFERIFGILRDR